jgi:hypothetical protein
MSSQEASNQIRGGQPAVQTGPGSAQPGARPGQLSPETLQYLLDQAASFQMIATPGQQRSEAIMSRGNAGNVIGFMASETLRRFTVELDQPDSGRGVRAKNVPGESAGRLDLRWLLIPHDFMARPELEPPPTPLDVSRSQRFVMQLMTFTFGDGRDGFRSFGTGRTFPAMVGGRPRLVAAAIGNIIEGFGKFAGHEGNFTLCGDIVSGQGFTGHIVVRVTDEDGALRSGNALPPLNSSGEPEQGITYLAWAAQKGRGPDQENRFSLAPDGQVRGLIIPTQLKHLRADFAAQGQEGFRSTDLKIGPVIGREIGFGRGSQPGPPEPGTALNPFQFEGVAQYSFFDDEGRAVGAITTNVLEGRRFDMSLRRAPGEPGYRFGFFGPIVFGSGCFQGVEGMFYGATGSILYPPPGTHVITHFYVARLHDPEGRFRAAVNRGR